MSIMTIMTIMTIPERQGQWRATASTIVVPCCKARRSPTPNSRHYAAAVGKGLAS